jgi:xylose dehydrogenase (NAD/NADP)
MYRHHPMTLKVRELVDTGSLGEVLYVRGSFSFLLNRSHDIRWQPESGGGSIWDIGCYPVSYALMVMGEAPLEVSGTQIIGESGVDVHFSGQLRFRNGRLAQVQSSFLLPYYTGIEIRGTRSTIQVPTPFNPKQEQISFTLITDDSRQEFSFKYPYLYQGEFDNLADVILDNGLPHLPLSESRKIIATLAGLVQSARQNRPLELE